MRLISAIRDKLHTAKNPSKGRYERKFLITTHDLRQVEAMIRINPAGFREIFKQRQINNIYLDTLDFKSYYDNVYGNTTRVKVRVRWYGETFGYIEKPVLEMKIKNGLAGRKRNYRLNPFTLDKSFTHETLTAALAHPMLPAWVKENLAPYRPALLNSYMRKYYVSSDRKARVTLDEKMAYYPIAGRNNSFIQRYEEKKAVIMELKYDPGAADKASDITQYFPMRMTKSSKYVNGVSIFHTNLAT